MNAKRLMMGFLLVTLISSHVNAQIPRLKQSRLSLNIVSLNINEQQWVKTDTSKLSLSINAILTNKNLANFRTTILNDLNKIAQGDWHIVQFNRSQDSSGMAKLYARATIRLKQKALTNVYLQTKNVSKVGLQYHVDDIDFTPSFSEMNTVRKQLRQKIYQQINDEINALKQSNPNQSFTLYKVVFSDVRAMPQSNAPQTLMLARSTKIAASSETSYQLTLGALVKVAANRRVL